VICEHGKPWFKDICSGKLLTRPLELSRNPTSSNLVAKQEEMGEVNDKSFLKKYLCSCFEGIFNMP
jgi:hypothetical protein